MARNLYKSAMASSLGAGKLRASMYDFSSYDAQKEIEGMDLAYESEKLDTRVSLLADTLSLASTVAGRYGDISDDISTIESEYGKMEQPEGMLERLYQSTKIGFGIGEYKFGDKVVAAKDFAATSAGITQQNMFQEAMSNLLPKVDRPTMKVSSEGLGDYEFEDFDKEYEQDLYSVPKVDPIDTDEEIAQYMKQRYRLDI